MLASVAAVALLSGLTADQALARSRRELTVDPCADSRDADDIVVCGRKTGDGYRLPSTVTRADAGPLAGEVPTASANRFSAGGCGIFQGQRPCSRAETREWMAGGKDPVTVLMLLGTRLFDPDADAGPPIELPRQTPPPR